MAFLLLIMLGNATGTNPQEGLPLTKNKPVTEVCTQGDSDMFKGWWGGLVDLLKACFSQWKCYGRAQSRVDVKPGIKSFPLPWRGLCHLQGVCVSQHRQAATTTTNNHQFMTKTPTIN